MQTAEIPADLSGMRVLDIGTTNGGTAFECERRGARSVVAVDIVEATHFGFSDLRAFLGSHVEFIRASVYELPQLLRPRFDLVIFWGVLYHLRHPLLALDAIRELSRGMVSIESAIADAELGDVMALPLVRFFRGGELANDPSNWFAPTSRALEEWVLSCGFETTKLAQWPEAAPTRGLVNARPSPGIAEYAAISYEAPLRAAIAGADPEDDR